ncbi:MAG TPA: NADH-quinone oxidoreductase subunit N [Acidimicrobiia bacterium]|nr:NADH-quinone oxidoreductase subunit N [Acidimicrobiia bacterium]
MTPLDTAGFAANWQAALPGIVVVVTACAVMMVDLALGGRGRGVLAGVGLLGLAVAIAVAVSAWNGGTDPAGFQDMLRADRYGLFFTIVVCLSAALTLLMSVEFVREWGLPAGDFYTLVLLSTAGMVFLALANDLIVVFVALETMSVGVYVLTGLLRGDLRSNEGSMKYFLLGAFASGFLLYGVAFFYGATTSTHLDVIAEAIARRPLEPFVLLGMAFVLVGFSFKVALIPFQAWTPDAYEGAPTVVTAFMAVAVKAAAFAAFARVFFVSLSELAGQWTSLLALLSALTMTVGNVVAISQRNVKRMLAYSSIAHAGYALLGLVANSRAGGAALLFYLTVYVFMNVGAFGVLVALGRRGEPRDRLDDLAGVGLRHPLLGLCMTLFLLSLGGVPPMAGFIGKFYLFSSVIDAGHTGLALIAVVNSVISIYYYLGPIVQMYVGDAATAEPKALPARPWLAACIAVALVGTLYLGVFPAAPMRLALSSFGSLR